jgi:DEAD/DEAH box helicase domain-containing protein
MDDIRQKFPLNISQNIVCYQILSSRNAEYGEFPPTIHSEIKKMLFSKGIERLYSHQSEALSDILENKNIVVTSGVSSGKSLCYQIPIIQSIVENSLHRTLLLFPTKALTQDQKKHFAQLMPTLKMEIYDGDTPAEQRKKIRSNANIVFTNPDMLHLGILPHHTQWREFFANLRYIVVDEIHIYRGIFGSHFANVIRRIKRIAEFYGSKPQFILTSATISNVKKFAESLIEENVTVLSEDGSPQPEKHILLYNPPFVNQELGIRRSSMQECVKIGEELLQMNLQTLIFTSSRRSVELLVRYLQKGISNETIKGYRSGYLPGERRELENGIRNGEIRGIVATNALELGIDIGGLDAVLLHGYPGTIASTRQQIGRAGRRDKPAVAIFVASANLLDQYLLSHPDFFLHKEPEEALIDPDNPFILLHHLKCALFEKPFFKHESFGNLPQKILVEYFELLQKYQFAYQTEKKIYWKASSYPADDVSLRTAGSGNFLLQTEQEVIGMVDENSAYWLTHPKAIYMHGGETFFVNELNFEKKIAYLEAKPSDYFTQTQMHTKFEIVELKAQEDIIGGQKCFGKLKVTDQVVGFKKMKWFTNEIIGHENLDLPAQEMLTCGYWFVLEDSLIQKLTEEKNWNNQKQNYGKNWKQISQIIRERDKNQCRNCGIKEEHSAFAVHHIQPLRTFHSHLEANKAENLITLCPSCHALAEKQQYIQSGLSGLTYLLHEISPLFLMCAPHDIRFHYEANSALFDNQYAVICHDAYPGGIGLSEKLAELHYRLLWEGLQVIQNCQCEQGCPACTGPVAENGIGAKEQVKAVLKNLVSKRYD